MVKLAVGGGARELEGRVRFAVADPELSRRGRRTFSGAGKERSVPAGGAAAARLSRCSWNFEVTAGHPPVNPAASDGCWQETAFKRHPNSVGNRGGFRPR